ncbi:hypothetical protein DFH06DRAFT_1291240 [Mycena polygramma]|nr:hypothetical protein DFH06DRAFT_1291240 [Mycena polygramma]
MGRDFGIALSFGVVGLCSATVTVYRFLRMLAGRGTLALENDAESEEISSIRAAVFDIAGPEDFIDGHPLNEAAFWARVRTRKIALAIVLMAAALVVLRPAGQAPYSSIHVVYAAYLALMATASVCTADLAAHTYYTRTLAALSSSAFFALLADAIIPAAEAQPRVATLQILTLVLYSAATSLAVTTPRGPLLYYPPDKIYSAKVLDSKGISAANNVNGVVNASPLGCLFFFYISKIAALPSGFGVADLPLLTADMRALVTFAQIRACVRIQGQRALPGVRFGLAIVRANAAALAGVQFLSALNAASRYAPPYLMRLLLRQLELQRDSGDAAENKDVMRWVCGGSIRRGPRLRTREVFVGWGQLWNLAHIAGVRIVSQTTALLFAKTLLRKDTLAASTPAVLKPLAKNANGVQFAHKAQILTLMSQDVHRVADLSKHVYTLTGASLEYTLIDITES